MPRDDTNIGQLLSMKYHRDWLREQSDKRVARESKKVLSYISTYNRLANLGRLETEYFIFFLKIAENLNKNLRSCMLCKAKANFLTVNFMQ